MAAEYLGLGEDDGTVMGRATTDLIAFHNKTPISQRANAALTATVTAFAMTGASVVSAQTLSAGLASLFDAVAEIRSTLVAYGLHKGGA